jgi:Pheophorbide a oxygenase
VDADNPEVAKERWTGSVALRLILRLVPVTRGTSRILATTETPALAGTRAGRLRALRPRFDMHLERNAIFDGDGVFLHNLSQDLRAGARAAPLFVCLLEASRILATTEAPGLAGALPGRLRTLRPRFDMHLERNAIFEADGVSLHNLSHDLHADPRAAP